MEKMKKQEPRIDTNQHEKEHLFVLIRVNSWLFLFLILFFCLPALAQELPKEIRGYKVHKTSISVKTSSTKAPQNPAPKPS